MRNQRQYVVAVPLPGRILFPNSGKGAHWASVADARKTARAASCIAAIEAMQRHEFWKPKLEWPTISGEFAWPSSRNFRDPDSLVASLKATIDGLEDAELIADDRRVHLGRFTQHQATSRSEVGLVVRIRP